MSYINKSFEGDQIISKGILYHILGVRGYRFRDQQYFKLKILAIHKTRYELIEKFTGVQS